MNFSTIHIHQNNQQDTAPAQSARARYSSSYSSSDISFMDVLKTHIPIPAARIKEPAESGMYEKTSSFTSLQERSAEMREAGSRDAVTRKPDRENDVARKEYLDKKSEDRGMPQQDAEAKASTTLQEKDNAHKKSVHDENSGDKDENLTKKSKLVKNREITISALAEGKAHLKIAAGKDELPGEIENIDASDSINMQNFLSGLSDQLKNIINTMNQTEQSGGEELKASLIQVSDALAHGKRALSKKMLTRLFREIKLFLKQQVEREGGFAPKGKNTRFLTGLKGLMKMLRSVKERSAQKMITNAAAGAGTSPTEISARIDSLVDTLKNDGFMKHENERNTGNIRDLTLNSMRNMAQKSSVKGSAATLKNSSFNEQMQEMINRARVVVKNGKNASLTLKLYPEKLGSVNINLGLEQGILHGRFLVESNEARDTLLQNLAIIREKLENAGVSIGEFQVNVNHNEERFNQDDGDEALPSLVRSQDTNGILEEFESNAGARHNGAIDMVI